MYGLNKDEMKCARDYDWNFFDLIEIEELESELDPTKRPKASYSFEKALKLCTLIASDTRSLKQICDAHSDLPSAKTVQTWLVYYPVFARNYGAAKKYQAQLLIDEIIEISDDTNNCDPQILGWSKERIKTRQWLASRLLPKIYGDQKQVEELKGENDRVKAELAELRAKLDKVNASEY